VKPLLHLGASQFLAFRGTPHHSHHEYIHDDGQDRDRQGRKHCRPLAALGEGRPYREQPIFLFLHLRYDMAKLVHPLSANAGHHNLARFQVSAFFV
jgi:hypothetical protein